MAITFSAVSSAVFTGTTFTPTTPTAPGGGALSSANIIWCITFTNDGAGNPAAENGWTKQAVADLTAAPNVHIWSRVATGSEGATLPTPTTFAGSAATNLYLIFATAGGDTSSPQAGTATAADSNANGATLAIPSYTPPASNIMLVCVGGGSGNNITNTTTESVTGMTELGQINSQGTPKKVLGAFFEQLASANATGTRTLTLTQSAGGMAGVLIGMNPAPSGEPNMAGWLGN